MVGSRRPTRQAGRRPDSTLGERPTMIPRSIEPWDSKKMATAFTPARFLTRLIMATVIVLLTYNPTGFSYLSWLGRALRDNRAGAAHALAGVVVVAGWAILVRASYRSLGRLGLFLGAAFFGTLIWFLRSVGVLTLQSHSAITWIALLCLSGLLAIGMSWSHVRRRLTGQIDVDAVDED